MSRMFASLVAVAALNAGFVDSTALATDNWSLLTADKKVKASVSGNGKTKFEAENDADKAAREVSRGSYSTVRKNTTGSGTSWTCSMTIEYTEK